MPQNEYLTTGAIAKLLGVTTDTVGRWITDNGLPALRLPSGRYRVPRKSFLEWLEPKMTNIEKIREEILG
jgi:excisionase family DNA binding protein